MSPLTPAYWEAPPPSEWWSALLVLGGLVALIGFGEFTRSRFGWSPEFTRKLVHVSVGIPIVFTTSIFSVPLPAVVLALVFIVVNVAALRLGILKGLHDTRRQTFGTVYYPLSFLILVLLFWYSEPVILILSFLVLAFGDAAAAIIGESVRNPAVFNLSRDRKSLQGSFAMFAVSFAVLTTGLLMVLKADEIPLTYILACAGIAATSATAVEALSSGGLDNLTIPLSVAFVLSYFLIPNSHADVQQFTLGASLGIFIAVGSVYAGFLSPSGGVATFLLALVVFGVGGWQWTIPLVTFFLLSSLLSKSRTEPSASTPVDGNNVRNHAQVFANGGIAGILVMCSYWYPDVMLYPIFLGSIAAVTADTWGTELGTQTKNPTVLITSWREVPPGTNGGISLRGMAAGLAGTLVIGASALFWIEAAWIPWIVLVGMAGTVFDSFLGATLQAQFRCPVCEKLTEHRMHCNHQPTIHERGISWLTNNGVNWLCAGTGAAFMAAVVLLRTE